MNKKLKLSKYFLFISILSFLAIFSYIVSIGYSKMMGQQTDKNNIKTYEYEIIDINIDTDILEKIKQRQEFNYQTPQLDTINNEDQ